MIFHIYLNPYVSHEVDMHPTQFFKCLADETRLQCLMLLQQQGELCVCELMEALQESQPKISRHLALLRKQGLLLDRRQGQWIFYQINPALPDWAKASIKQVTHNNPTFIHSQQQRLIDMENRPDRTTLCC